MGERSMTAARGQLGTFFVTLSHQIGPENPTLPSPEARR